MNDVHFSMGVSLDGFIADPNGAINWTAPNDELHRFHNDQTRELGAHLLGRRLYEEMLYWENPDEHPEFGATERDFADVWERLPKVVFSNTLEAVRGNARLATAGPAEEVAALKEQVEGEIAVGGAGLAAELTELGLIDEYRLFVSPVVLGGGTPYFPALRERIALELVDTRTFSLGVVYLRYRRA